MKLKKSFWAKTLALTFLIFTSCESTELSVPVPGQGEAKKNNIYVEYYNLGETYYKLEDYNNDIEMLKRQEEQIKLMLNLINLNDDES